MEGQPKLLRKGIPAILSDPNSELVQLIALAGDLPLGRLRRQTAEATRETIHENCIHYKKSRVDDLLCQSGEDNGRAYRGRTCWGCTAAGQFKANGFFVGEITLPGIPATVAA